MENQNAPLVIRPSRTPKTNPKKNFCSKSLSSMGAKLVVFQPFTVFDFPFRPPPRFSVLDSTERGIDRRSGLGVYEAMVQYRVTA